MRRDLHRRIAVHEAGLRARLAAQAGFTLPELLVVVAMVPFVLLAALSTLDTGAKIAPRNVQYSDAVGEVGGGLSRAIREIRQAYRVIGTTPNAITFLVVANGVDTQVTINCGVTSSATDAGGGALRRCVRTSATVGATMPSPTTGAILVDRLTNGTADDPVFDYSPDAIAPTFVHMTVSVPSRGEGRADTISHPIVVDDGTLLRNNALGS